jgi:carbon starvation protein CstA
VSGVRLAAVSFVDCVRRGFNRRGSRFFDLASSVRHGATSIAEITKEKLGTGAGRAMMAFIWIALIYVIVAFHDITAGTFVSGTEELQARI